MPNRQAADPSLVEISGLDEEKIISCLEKLSALEEVTTHHTPIRSFLKYSPNLGLFG